MIFLRNVDTFSKQLFTFFYDFTLKGGKPGLYVGVELDGPTGKMSGKVKDDIYFACLPNHGAWTSTHLTASKPY